MGWSEVQPAVFVAHADKAHIHVHVVTTAPVYGGGLWDVFRFSRKRLVEIAEICSDAFDLPRQTAVSPVPQKGAKRQPRQRKN